MLDQHRSTQRKVPRTADDEAALTSDITALAKQYGRYGYRRVIALLKAEGWACNHKRVERIWRREGLKVPARQPKRGRLWLNDGSCVRLRPERANQVWAYDFVEDCIRDGRKIRLLNVVEPRGSPASAWRSGLGASWARPTCRMREHPAGSTCWPTCSSPAARRPTSARTTSYIGKLRDALANQSALPVCTDVGRHGNPKPGGFPRQGGVLGHSKHRVRRWRRTRRCGPHRP